MLDKPMNKFKSWCLNNDVEINGKTIFIFIFVLILLFKPGIIFKFFHEVLQGGGSYDDPGYEQQYLF